MKTTLLVWKLLVLFCALVTLSTRAKADDAASEKECSRVVEFFPQPTESEKKILEALAKPTSVDFVETPLQDVVDYLKDFHGIEIQIDKKSLEDQGLGNAQVTRRLTGVPLRSALRLMLPQLGLGFVVANDVLLITTLEVEDAETVTRTYPVGDLVGSNDYTSLRNAITSTAGPTAIWSQSGGPGEIAVLETAKSIIISQTQRAHDEVLQLLRSLRAAQSLATEHGR
jgi:hypothetical protein